VVRYLLVEWLHGKKEEIVEFCRVHGIPAGRKKFGAAMATTRTGNSGAVLVTDPRSRPGGVPHRSH